MSGDLHCHTKLSDGSLGIDDLIVLAKKQGIKTIAITDHDCLAGTVRGKLIGDRHGVKVIPGVELSCTDKDSNSKVHIIGYLSDSPDRLEGLCRRNLLASKRASQYMMLKVAQLYPISPELVLKCAAGSTCVYEQHIMHALFESGVSEGIYDEVYDRLFTKESPDNIIVEAKYPEPEDVIAAIHEAGGIAVMSQPSIYEDNYEMLDGLIKKGLDGIEVWHSSNSESQREVLLKKAKENGLVTTGGSDFHGMYNRGKVPLGSEVTPAAQLTSLLSYKMRKRKQAKKAE
ncbi:MAG TPA: PHP domain-containing protein [Clostridia bacterium]|nr:PHP domain-containing protein [Clostridia bacterium]